MKTKVNWRDWSKESFEKAEKEDKPILLDLTAVWCHWCHVMDMTSYSNEKIAEIINQDFVPIKVYVDKRPDIRERYNMGGFPSTVFLNPEGLILTGDTYVPPERFKLMLETVKSSYKTQKEEIKKRIADATEKITHKEARKAEINEDIFKEILLSIEDNFDSYYGGFGLQPKFPNAEVVDLLFLQYQKTKLKRYLDMALKTLDGMHEGIYDKVDFGFFRYSVTQDWKMPHYEKMLDTNAGLLRNYAVAFNITKNEKYRKIATEVLDYANRFLSDQKNCGFYGSQDADEEFYQLKPEERKNRDYPFVDKTVYVDWNAMMISSYIKAGAILNDKKATEFAIKTANFILDKCYDKKTGLCHYYDDKPNINGLLSDNIHFLNCLIDIYFAAQDKKHLQNMQEIADFILKSLHDEKSGGFFDKISKEGDFGVLKHKEKQFLENSFATIVFLRLYFLTNEQKYRNAAEKTLLYFVGSYLNFGYFASMYAIAADMLANGPIKVDIVGRQDMIKICLSVYNPRIAVNFIDKNDNADAGYAAEGAYICKGALCKGPIKELDKLEQELNN